MPQLCKQIHAKQTQNCALTFQADAVVRHEQHNEGRYAQQPVQVPQAAVAGPVHYDGRTGRVRAPGRARAVRAGAGARVRARVVAQRDRAQLPDQRVAAQHADAAGRTHAELGGAGQVVVLHGVVDGDGVAFEARGVRGLAVRGVDRRVLVVESPREVVRAAAVGVGPRRHAVVQRVVVEDHGLAVAELRQHAALRVVGHRHVQAVVAVALLQAGFAGLQAVVRARVRVGVRAARARGGDRRRRTAADSAGLVGAARARAGRHERRRVARLELCQRVEQAGRQTLVDRQEGI
ncbi:hypothetical protein ON010_g12861 [Phytophthora cinnamomi]|nr:hypothetical protein ON010_g12861 [Phytophthora cinnamomi]